MKIVSSREYYYPRYVVGGDCFMLESIDGNDLLLLRKCKYVCKDEAVVLFVNADSSDEPSLPFSILRTLSDECEAEALLQRLQTKYLGSRGLISDKALSKVESYLTSV